MMFCEWCCCFDKNEHRNQFVKGGTSMKMESIKKHDRLYALDAYKRQYVKPR